MKGDTLKRCAWCCGDELSLEYHDKEWGTPLHDDKRHFEYLLMEAMQCGLSWSLMLKKRSIFRECFADFDISSVAVMGDDDVASILNTEGMIRSERKIRAIINNARCFLKIIDEFGSFDRYIWSFSDYKTHIYLPHQCGLFEVKNELSDKIAADMKKRGFKYLGSITLYSHLQACGIINDHNPGCWKYEADLAKSDPVFIE